MVRRSRNFRWSALVCGIIAAVVIFGFWYILQPAMNIKNAEFGWFLFGCTAIVAGMAFLEWLYHDSHYGSGISKFQIILWILPVVMLLYMLIGALSGAPIGNSETYKDIITVRNGNFSEDFDNLEDDNEFVFMDLDTAQRLGDRVLGSVPNATWYEIDNEYNLITYQGRQYRLSPLKYGGLFKYGKAKNTGIPGYVLVDCKTSEARFVKTKEPIFYSPSAYFGHDLRRHLRSQFPDLAFNSMFMEIDEEGTPFWVIAVTEPNAGFWGAREVTKFILTNASTGESKLYGLDEKPEWIDHVQGLDYMMQVLNWHLRYVNGWWNPSSTGVLKTTYEYAKGNSSSSNNQEPNFFGYTSFVNSEGQVMVFTGITPVNRTESNVGFMTINATTGEYTYYDLPGAEESSSQVVVEGLVQNYGYQATFPFMVNIGGHPTYLMNMKDKSGLIQRYAMVNYENYSQAFVGNSFEDTLEGYLKAIGGSFVHQVEETKEISFISGNIEEKYEASIEGTTYYYYIIDGELYRASIMINEMQVAYKTGDNVKISYTDGEIRLVTKIEKE